MSDFMQDLVGVGYRDGGLSPQEGFDCIGLVRWVLREGTGVALPENPVAWRHYGRIIRSPRSIERYDLLFFCPLIPDVITHVGIGLVLGMMTFGLAMLIGNVAFIPPEMILRLAGQGRGDVDQPTESNVHVRSAKR